MHFAKEEWANVPQKTCRKLIDRYKNLLEAVIKNKGYAIGLSKPRLRIILNMPLF